MIYQPKYRTINIIEYMPSLEQGNITNRALKTYLLFSRLTQGASHQAILFESSLCEEQTLLLEPEDKSRNYNKYSKESISSADIKHQSTPKIENIEYNQLTYHSLAADLQANSAFPNLQ